MNSRKLILLLSLSTIIALIFACSGGYGTSGGSGGYPVTSADITESDVLRHIKYLASDEMNGRRTGTPGGDMAEQYIAGEFKRLGLEPVDEDGDYMQPFDFPSGAELGEGSYMSAEISGEIVTFENEVEMRPFPFSVTEDTTVELVFAGYGISLKDSSYDDYADIDVEGKAVVVLRYSSEKDDRESKFAGYMSLFYKFRNARDHGAAAMFLVTGTVDDSTDKLVDFNYTRYRKSGIIAFSLTRKAANKLMAPLGRSLDELQSEILESGKTMSIDIPGLSVSMKADVKPVYSSGVNVMAVIRGSDPVLRNDYFVIGSHYDHLGIGGRGSRAPDSYGEVHYGADDNASGTAGMLELAEYFSANRDKLRHSVLFQAYGAEESGLLGSRHYVDNPLIPLENTYAMLNLDMIGRDTDTSIVMNGFATSSIWEEIVDDANKDVGIRISKKKLSGGGSDHASFNSKEIPNMFFFTGVHGDYHKPSDTWDKINYEAEVRILTLAKNIAWGLDDLEMKPEYVKAEEGSSAPSRMSFRVVLGVTPDYAYEGAGLKITGVRDGGTASKAGIISDDIIIRMDEKEIMSIEDYMSILQLLNPGDEVKISVKRGEEVLELSAKMQSP